MAETRRYDPQWVVGFYDTYGDKEWQRFDKSPAAEVRQDPVKWAELLKMELEACREPGCLDLGTHLIGVVEKG